MLQGRLGDIAGDVDVDEPVAQAAEDAAAGLLADGEAREAVAGVVVVGALARLVAHAALAALQLAGRQQPQLQRLGARGVRRRERVSRLHLRGLQVGRGQGVGAKRHGRRVAPRPIQTLIVEYMGEIELAST